MVILYLCDWRALVLLAGQEHRGSGRAGGSSCVGSSSRSSSSGGGGGGGGCGSGVSKEELQVYITVHDRERQS